MEARTALVLSGRDARTKKINFQKHSRTGLDPFLRVRRATLRRKLRGIIVKGSYLTLEFRWRDNRETRFAYLDLYRSRLDQGLINKPDSLFAARIGRAGGGCSECRHRRSGSVEIRSQR